MNAPSTPIGYPLGKALAMRTRPSISARSALIPDTTELVDLIKVPLRRFQTPTYTEVPPKLNVNRSELFTKESTTDLTFGNGELVKVRRYEN